MQNKALDILQRIRTLYSSSSERSQIVVKNAVGSFAIKCFSMAVDFAKVPVLLTYLDPEHYGVYVTLASIIAWTNHFDFGLGAGLRYKLTQAISKNDAEWGKRLVSTAYVSLTAIMLLVLMIATPILVLLDWNTIINTHIIGAQELTLCVVMILAVFVVQFVLELITVVLQADQKAAISSIFKPIANILTLVCVFILRTFSNNSLTLACLAITAPLVIVLLIANVVLYKKQYHSVAPSFKSYSRASLRDIYSMGLKYFVSQVSGLVIFNTASFLISHYVNPTEAAVYNSAWTYFGIIVMFNAMVLQPLVTAVTDAYTKGGKEWIKNMYRKIAIYSCLLTIASLFLLGISQFVFHIWIGEKLIVTWGLSIWMTVYFIINIWNTPYLNFLGGVGKYNVMVILSFCKIILFIPVAITLVRLLGAKGMIISILLVNSLPNFIVGRIQYHLIINNKAKGIWNK